MALRFRQWPDAAMRRLAAAVDRGVPITALRTSTHAFRFPAGHPSAYRHFNDFGRNVLGENWVSHWGANRRGATKGVIEPGAENDPLLRGVGLIFGMFLQGALRNPAAADKLGARLIFGFAVTEALGLIAAVVALALAFG